jgi:hypothetical protein
VVVGVDWGSVWNYIASYGRNGDMKQLDTVQMNLNGHVLYTRNDFNNKGNSPIKNYVENGGYICKECHRIKHELLDTICPNKGVGEIQVVKPVFMFYLTDGKTMAVVGDELFDGDEYFLVKCNGKNEHVFMKRYVKYVVKHESP